MKNFMLAFLFLVPAASLAETPAEKGLRIATMCQKANKGFKGETSQSRMFLYNSSGESVERELFIKRREMSPSEERSILTFLKPSDVKGSKLLTWTHPKKDDDQWLYLPPLKRVKRITSRVRSGSFLGSEFSYEDFGGKDVAKYTHKFLKESKIKGRKVWVLEQVPKSKHSGYSKEVAWIDQTYKTPLKVEFFDRKGELLKVSTFTGHKKHGKWWKAKTVTMENVQTKNKSVMSWDKIQLNVALSTEDFVSENLKE